MKKSKRKVFDRLEMSSYIPPGNGIQDYYSLTLKKHGKRAQFELPIQDMRKLIPVLKREIDTWVVSGA